MEIAILLSLFVALAAVMFWIDETNYRVFLAKEQALSDLEEEICNEIKSKFDVYNKAVMKAEQVIREELSRQQEA